MPDSFDMPIISVLALTAATLLLICELRNNLRGVAAILAIAADIAMFIINFAAGKELIVSAFALILQCVVLLIAIQIYAKDKSLSSALTPKQRQTTALTTESTVEDSVCESDETNDKVCAESAACENAGGGEISDSVTSATTKSAKFVGASESTEIESENSSAKNITTDSTTSAATEADTTDSATSAATKTDTSDSATSAATEADTSDSTTSAATKTDTSDSATSATTETDTSDSATSGTAKIPTSKTIKTATNTTDKTVRKNTTTKSATSESASNSDSATHEKAQTDTAREKVTKRRATSKPKKKGADDAV